MNIQIVPPHPNYAELFLQWCNEAETQKQIDVPNDALKNKVKERQKKSKTK
jgi:hypothetical protein